MVCTDREADEWRAWIEGGSEGWKEGQQMDLRDTCNLIQKYICTCDELVFQMKYEIN